MSEENKGHGGWRGALKRLAPGADAALTAAQAKVQEIAADPFVKEKVSGAKQVFGEVATGVKSAIAEAKEQAPAIKAAAGEAFEQVTGQVSAAVDKRIEQVQTAATDARTRVAGSIEALKGGGNNAPKPQG